MGKIVKNGVSYTVGAGLTSYAELSDKPSINSVSLAGNKTAAQLGLATTNDIPTVSVTQVVSSGTKIATVTVDSTSTDLYAPEGSSGTTDYTDLTNKPSIESVTLSGNKTASDLGLVKSSDLATVATSGSYADLSNKPSIPTVSVTQVQSTGTKIATVTIDGSGTDLYAPSGGGSTYTAGDGIDISNDEISVDVMPSADIAEIMSTLPSTRSGYVKYSTTEQVVGEWIDGKLLYQKTLSASFGTITDGTNSVIDCGLISSEMNKVVNMSGMMLHPTSGDVPLPYLFPSTTPNKFVNMYNYDKHAYSRSNWGEFSNGTVYITVQYTKTTD